MSRVPRCPGSGRTATIRAVAQLSSMAGGVRSCIALQFHSDGILATRQRIILAPDRKFRRRVASVNIQSLALDWVVVDWRIGGGLSIETNPLGQRHCGLRAMSLLS